MKKINCSLIDPLGRTNDYTKALISIEVENIPRIGESLYLNWNDMHKIRELLELNNEKCCIAEDGEWRDEIDRFNNVVEIRHIDNVPTVYLSYCPANMKEINVYIIGYPFWYITVLTKHIPRTGEFFYLTSPQYDELAKTLEETERVKLSIKDYFHVKRVEYCTDDENISIYLGVKNLFYKMILNLCSRNKRHQINWYQKRKLQSSR